MSSVTVGMQVGSTSVSCDVSMVVMQLFYVDVLCTCLVIVFTGCRECCDGDCCMQSAGDVAVLSRSTVLSYVAWCLSVNCRLTLVITADANTALDECTVFMCRCLDKGGQCRPWSHLLNVQFVDQISQLIDWWIDGWMDRSIDRSIYWLIHWLWLDIDNRSIDWIFTNIQSINPINSSIHPSIHPSIYWLWLNIDVFFACPITSWSVVTSAEFEIN